MQVSVVSNASNGADPAATDDDASLVQGAAHSAFVGGGCPQQAASEVQVSNCLDTIRTRQDIEAALCQVAS